MNSPSAFQSRVARTIGRILSPAGPSARLAVFCYHQVLEHPDPMRPLEPDIAAFEADLDRISAWFNVLALPEAAEAMVSGTLPERAACITFDDGYLNNLELAAPALESRGLPATFFITSGALERGIMWNDLIIDAVAAAGVERNDDSLRSAMPDSIGDAPPRVVAKRIIDAIKYLPLEERWEMASHFYRDNVAADPPRKMMRAEDVAALARRGFDIGAHTVNHPILARLEDSLAAEEIEASVRWVAQAIGATPRSFAYPNGRPGVDFGPEHTTQARNAGCTVAVSTEWALASRDSDRFAVPRIGPWWRLGHGGLTGLARVYAKSWLAS